jgi:hypothetical protein
MAASHAATLAMKIDVFPFFSYLTDATKERSSMHTRKSLLHKKKLLQAPLKQRAKKELLLRDMSLSGCNATSAAVEMMTESHSMMAASQKE